MFDIIFTCNFRESRYFWKYFCARSKNKMRKSERYKLFVKRQNVLLNKILSLNSVPILYWLYSFHLLNTFFSSSIIHLISLEFFLLSLLFFSLSWQHFASSRVCRARLTRKASPIRPETRAARSEERIGVRVIPCNKVCEIQGVDRATCVWKIMAGFVPRALHQTPLLLTD